MPVGSASRELVQSDRRSLDAIWWNADTRAIPLADVISPAALATNDEFFVECFVRPAIQAMSLDGRSKP
jgi:hypothetical protein